METEAYQLLRQARTRATQRKLAEVLGVAEKTVARWDRREIEPPKLIIPALANLLNRSKLPPRNADFTFIDLFAGIGGMRLGFEDNGGRCLFTSEWDALAVRTYRENFSDDHEIAGDITKVKLSDIPNHDVLLAGFPCQPFSIAGVSKKNALGRPHGFECTTQGTLFFDVARIIATKRPKAFLLENVKNLVSHDKKKTFRVILDTLENELKYKVHWDIIDAAQFVPQHRERVLILGFREDTKFDWEQLPRSRGRRAGDVPRHPSASHVMKSVLHPENGTELPDGVYTFGPRAEVSDEFFLSAKLWQYLKDYKERHRMKGNGFGFGQVGPDDVARTLSARYHKDGSEILVSRGPRRTPRKLTPRECARLMGFPESFRIPVSNTRAWRQFGNSVVVPMIREVARVMKPHIMELVRRDAGQTGQPDLFMR